MGESSPLVAHTLPWTAMLFSLALAAAFSLAAMKIVRLREY
jgi:negative regulator of sigma E activity